MTDQEEIDHLKSTTPRVELTRWQKVARVLAGVFAGVAVLALVVSVYAVRKAAAVSQKSLQVATCLNASLAVRNDLTQQDHLNEARKIADQKVAVGDQAAGVRLILSGVPREQARGTRLYERGVNEFVQALVRWQARDNQINAERAAHPLGRC